MAASTRPRSAVRSARGYPTASSQKVIVLPAVTPGNGATERSEGAGQGGSDGKGGAERIRRRKGTDGSQLWTACCDGAYDRRGCFRFREAYPRALATWIGGSVGSGGPLIVGGAKSLACARKATTRHACMLAYWHGK